MYRIYDADGHSVADLIAKADQPIDMSAPFRYVDPQKPWENRYFTNCTAKALHISDHFTFFYSFTKGL